MGGIARWSLEEEFVFEAALANSDLGDSEDGAGGLDFASISQLLPGKSAADVELRYNLLLDDIAKIEDGEDVSVVYYGVQGAHGPPNTPNAKGRLQYIQGLIAEQRSQLANGTDLGVPQTRIPELSPDKKMKL